VLASFRTGAPGAAAHRAAHARGSVRSAVSWDGSPENP